MPYLPGSFSVKLRIIEGVTLFLERGSGGGGECQASWSAGLRCKVSRGQYVLPRLTTRWLSRLLILNMLRYNQRKESMLIFFLTYYNVEIFFLI